MGGSLGGNCECPGYKEKVVTLGENASACAYPGAYGNGSTGGSSAAGSSGEQFSSPVIPPPRDYQDISSSSKAPFAESAQPLEPPDPQVGRTAPGVAEGGDGRTANEWADDQAQFAHLPPLPEGWIRVKSRTSGGIYYCYSATGQTTFTEPTGPPSQVEEGAESALPPGWEVKISRSTGQVYYWNQDLQKSQFERPTAEEGEVEALPPGWEEVVSKTTGQVYYWNANLQKSTFERPTAEGGLQKDSEGLPPGWVSMVSRSTGKTYYFNTVTQESQFELPVA